MSRPHATLRLFFALWPDDAALAALADLVRSLHAQCGGRPVPARKLHLTLLFLGSVRAELVPDLRHTASRVTALSSTLALDRVEYWPRNQLVCMSASHCPTALVSLAAELARAARSLGLTVEERPYVPHITLLRSASRRGELRSPRSIAWRAAEFALVRSVAGRESLTYETIDQWPITAGG